MLAMCLEFLQYLALAMLYYPLPHPLRLNLATCQGELFQITAAQKRACQEDLQVTSPRSLPLLSKDETWAFHPGISWQSQTRSWQPISFCLLSLDWL